MNDGEFLKKASVIPVTFFVTAVLALFRLSNDNEMIVLFALGIILVISPVTIRNWVVGRDLVLLTSQAGQNFYIGNNPRASGFFEHPDRIRLNPRFEEEDFRQEALRLTGRRDMKPPSSRRCCPDARAHCCRRRCRREPRRFPPRRRRRARRLRSRRHAAAQPARRP